MEVVRFIQTAARLTGLPKDVDADVVQNLRRVTPRQDSKPQVGF